MLPKKILRTGHVANNSFDGNKWCSTWKLSLPMSQCSRMTNVVSHMDVLPKDLWLPLSPLLLLKHHSSGLPHLWSKHGPLKTHHGMPSSNYENNCLQSVSREANFIFSGKTNAKGFLNIHLLKNIVHISSSLHCISPYSSC